MKWTIYLHGIWRSNQRYRRLGFILARRLQFVENLEICVTLFVIPNAKSVCSIEQNKRQQLDASEFTFLPYSNHFCLALFYIKIRLK